MKNTSNMGVSPIKTKYYNRFLTNSDFKSSEVEELLNTEKEKVLGLFQDRKNSGTEVSVSDSFAQDGCASLNCNASTAICDGRLFSDVEKVAPLERLTYLTHILCLAVAVVLTNVLNPILVCVLKTMQVRIVKML